MTRGLATDNGHRVLKEYSDAIEILQKHEPELAVNKSPAQMLDIFQSLEWYMKDYDKPEIKYACYLVGIFRADERLTGKPARDYV